MQSQNAIAEQRENACRCPQCGDAAIILIQGHSICASCGTVIDQWSFAPNRDSAKGAKRSERRNSQPNDNIISLGSLEEIACPVDAPADFFKVSDSVEEKIMLALISVIKITNSLGLDRDVADVAIDIYGKLAKKCTFKGKSIRALSAAIVYTAGKKVGKPCGLREIARAIGINPNKIFRCYRFIIENLGFSPHHFLIDQYVIRICEKLALGKNLTDMVKNIVAAVENHLKVKGAISSIIAASIYIASKTFGEKRTQREIADATGITEATIRSWCKKIVEKIQLILTL